MTPERIAEMRALTDKVDLADTAVRTLLSEALDAIERVRDVCETDSYVDEKWEPHGLPVVIVSDVLAALERRAEA